MEDAYFTAEEYTDQSLSVIHHALRASRRRLVVGLVAHRAISTASAHSKGESPRSTSTETVVTVRRLAKEIVSIEEDVSVNQATGDPYHNVYTALIQTHLPELKDVGAIKYDADRKEVKPDSNLIALAMTAAIVSPIAQMLFHNAVASMHSESGLTSQGSIGD